jgi:hypothetical protein
MPDSLSPARLSSAVVRPHPLVRILALLAVALLLAAVSHGEARAATTLELDLPDPLTSSAQPVQLRVEGDFDEVWPGARMRVEVRGPGRVDDGELPIVGTREEDLGDLVGRLGRDLALGSELFGPPGAYRVSVTVAAPEGREARGGAWIGRVHDLPLPIDLATVWPVALGPQRSPQGVFVSQSVQDAVVPDASSAGSLYAFFRAADRFPEWRFTLAVEPLLLTQIQAMADGFRELAPDGAEVDGDEATAALAAQALETFRRVAGLGAVQVVPMPYASPHLPLIAAEGWSDGVEQMRLGKAQLVQDLALADDPDGAYPPGLELTTEGVAALTGASVDFTLAPPGLMEALAEAPEDGERPVRVRDAENNRLTLIPLNPGLLASLDGSWQEGRFFAALAAELAAGNSGPFVVAPADDYQFAPGPFLESVGRTLAANRWIRARTLGEVLRASPPATRPIFLGRYGTAVDGYVAESYAGRLREARAIAQDFFSATDSDRAPRDELRLLLYQAESRYWFSEGTDPSVANRGLALLQAVDDAVQQEYDKVDVVGDKSVIIMGDEGEVPVAVVNRTGYPMRLTVKVAGRGLTIKGESTQQIELGPQENIIRLPVKVSGSSGSLDVELLAGTSRVEAETVSVRAVSVSAVLPWLVGTAALVAAALILLLRPNRS